MKPRRIVVPVLAAALWLGACSKEPPPPEPGPTGPTPEELAEQARRDSIEAAREDSLRRAEEEARLAEEERMRGIAAAVETLREMVFFEYDQSDITSDAELTLRSKVEVLRANPAVHLRIEGHADERGSTEYNLALGSRRAESVMEFLVGFGLDPDRFTITSYGEERPLVNASNEAAWARNRRAEFVITAGEDQIQPMMDR